MTARALLLARRLLGAVRGPLGVYLIASIAARAGSIVLVPLYTRRLSVEAYGDYALAQTIVSLLPTIFTLGIASAIFRVFFGGDVERSRERSASLATWIIVLAVFGGVIAELGVLAFGRPGGQLFGRWELSCVVVASTGSAIAAVPHVYLRASERPYAAAAFQLTQFLVGAIGGIVLVAGFGRGLRGAIEAIALGGGVTGLASAVFILRSLRGPLDRGVLREVVSFSAPFIPHLVAAWVLGVADRWTMKGVKLDREVGAYSLAVTLVSLVFLVVSAFADSDNPRQGVVFRERGLIGLRELMPRTRVSYVAATLLPGLALVAAAPILSLVVGKQFVPALKLVPLLLIGSVFDALYYPSANIIYYTSRTRWVPVATVVGAVVNVGLNVALIPFFGVMGAIVARTVAAIARTVTITLGAHAAFRDGLAVSERSDVVAEGSPSGARRP